MNRKASLFLLLLLFQQFTDGCVNYEVGDTQFTFSLVLNVLNEHTIGNYSVTFTNVGGKLDIPAHLVTTGGAK